MSLPPPSRRTLMIIDRTVRWTCMAAVWLPIVVVAVWIVRLLALAWPDLGSGVGTAALDSLLLVALTAVLAIPIGVGAAVYLEEYGVHGRIGALIEFNVAQLAGVPSVIYGLLGLELFVRTLEWRLGLFVGAASLALLMLPMVTDGARAALRSVPVSHREAGLALGGTRWQVVRHVVLPRALPGMSSAALLATARVLGEAAPLPGMSSAALLATARVLGEAAPLLVLGALLAGGESGGALGLPVQIYAWLLDATPERAAAGALVLLAITLGLGTIGALLRLGRGPERALVQGQGQGQGRPR